MVSLPPVTPGACALGSHAPRNRIVSMMAATLGRSLVTLVKVSSDGKALTLSIKFSERVTAVGKILSKCLVNFDSHPSY